MASLAGLVNSRFSARLFFKNKSKYVENDKGRHWAPTSGLHVHVCVHIHVHTHHPHMHLEKDNKKLIMCSIIQAAGDRFFPGSRGQAMDSRQRIITDVVRG